MKEKSKPIDTKRHNKTRMLKIIELLEKKNHKILETILSKAYKMEL